MTATDIFNKPVSAQDSRMTVLWADGRCPAGTKDSQWQIGMKDIVLYDNSTADDKKNYQEVTFLLEFDAYTKVSPNPFRMSNGVRDPDNYDPDECPGVDPDPDSVSFIIEPMGIKMSGVGAQTVSGAPINDTVDIDTYLDSRSVSGETLKNVINLCLTTSGVNSYHRVSDIYIDEETGKYILIIDQEMLDGAMSPDNESEISCSLQLFKDKPKAQTAIQTQLQRNDEGYFKAYVFIHAWPSYKHILHVFEVIPFWLIKSKLDSNGIIPTWSYTFKCQVREKSPEVVHSSMNTQLQNYWENYNFTT